MDIKIGFLLLVKGKLEVVTKAYDQIVLLMLSAHSLSLDLGTP